MTSERAVEARKGDSLQALATELLGYLPDWPGHDEWERRLAALAATSAPRENGWEVDELVRRLTADTSEKAIADALLFLDAQGYGDVGRALLAAARGEPPEPGPAIDVERLAKALTRHRTNLYSGKGPDAYLEHACMGDCCPDIAAEYDRLGSE